MITEGNAFLSKADSSLNAAKLLHGKGFYDFAISRAYYTMFYVAEGFLFSRGHSFSKHSAVIAAFGQYFVKTGLVPLEYHRYLIEGQDWRNVGDYDTGAGLTFIQSEEQIRRAEKFLLLAADKLGSIQGNNLG